MSLKPRQLDLLNALRAAGATSPVSRQELVAACEASGAYACPPSWITQDSTRKAGRGMYDLPELLEVSGDSPAPAPVAPQGAPAAPPVTVSAEPAPALANMAMGLDYCMWSCRDAVCRFF